MHCNVCQTQYPDMCEDCLQVVKMSFEEEFLDEDRKMFVGSGEDACANMFNQPMECA